MSVSVPVLSRAYRSVGYSPWRSYASQPVSWSVCAGGSRQFGLCREGPPEAGIYKNGVEIQKK